LVSPVTRTIEIASIVLVTGDTNYFRADTRSAFETIAVRGDAERLSDEKILRLKITGIDPQLYLPAIPLQPSNAPMLLKIRLRVI